LLLSASDDGTALLWDLRINKRVMLIQDKATSEGGGSREIVKARFLPGSNFVLTAFGDSLATFDVRKPAIILSQAHLIHQSPAKNSEDINDIDVSVNPHTQ
jgi:WD40 repeat protein